VGSPGNQDFLSHTVDLDHGAGAAGYIGKLGEASWIERAHNLLSNAKQSQQGTHMTKLAVTTAAQFSYFMDDDDLLGVDEDDVNALFWPDEVTTLVLTEAYFHAMQGLFGFVVRDVFLQEVADFNHRQTPLNWDQRTWLGLANLVWAIASKWLQMAELSAHGIRIENHLVYYARARALGLDHRLTFDHPTIQGIQALGLLSFYLFLNGSITRYCSMPLISP
jgi:hypothetical protein